MNYLDLDLIKEHLNIDSGYTGSDIYLTHLGDVVEVVVEKHIDDSFEILAEANGGNLPGPLKQACLLLLGTYYANRENIAFASSFEVGNTFTYLCDLYRNYAGNREDEVAKMIEEINQRLAALEEYQAYDEGRYIEGGSLDVQVDGQKTDIELTTIDEGEY